MWNTSDSFSLFASNSQQQPHRFAGAGTSSSQSSQQQQQQSAPASSSSITLTCSLRRLFAALTQQLKCTRLTLREDRAGQHWLCASFVPGSNTSTADVGEFLRIVAGAQHQQFLLQRPRLLSADTAASSSSTSSAASVTAYLLVQESDAPLSAAALASAGTSASWQQRVDATPFAITSGASVFLLVQFFSLCSSVQPPLSPLLASIAVESAVYWVEGWSRPAASNSNSSSSILCGHSAALRTSDTPQRLLRAWAVTDPLHVPDTPLLSLRDFSDFCFPEPVQITAASSSSNNTEHDNNISSAATSLEAVVQWFFAQDRRTNAAPPNIAAVTRWIAHFAANFLLPSVKPDSRRRTRSSADGDAPAKSRRAAAQTKLQLRASHIVDILFSIQTLARSRFKAAAAQQQQQKGAAASGGFSFAEPCDAATGAELAALVDSRKREHKLAQIAPRPEVGTVSVIFARDGMLVPQQTPQRAREVIDAVRWSACTPVPFVAPHSALYDQFDDDSDGNANADNSANSIQGSGVVDRFVVTLPVFGLGAPTLSFYSQRNAALPGGVHNIVLVVDESAPTINRKGGSATLLLPPANEPTAARLIESALRDIAAKNTAMFFPFEGSSGGGTASQQRQSSASQSQTQSQSQSWTAASSQHALLLNASSQKVSGSGAAKASSATNSALRRRATVAALSPAMILAVQNIVARSTSAEFKRQICRVVGLLPRVEPPSVAAAHPSNSNGGANNNSNDAGAASEDDDPFACAAARIIPTTTHHKTAVLPRDGDIITALEDFFVSSSFVVGPPPPPSSK